MYLLLKDMIATMFRKIFYAIKLNVLNCSRINFLLRKLGRSLSLGSQISRSIL